MTLRRFIAAASMTMAAAVALAACSSAPTDSGKPSGGEQSAEAAQSSTEGYYPITVTDMAGNEVVIESVDSVAITDNRFFQLAADWDLPVTAAPLGLFSPNNPLGTSTEIENIGTHREPDFEPVVAADPNLIINGYRFASEEAVKGMKDAAPDAAFVDMTADDLSTEEYVEKSLTLMGEIFDKKEQAQKLIAEFKDAVAEAKEAYDPATKVMGLVTTGKDINYSNPKDGRGSSVYFDLIGMTPALDTEGSQDHTGDDISLEAIAGANPDFFLVLDRAAAVSDTAEDKAALDLIKGSPSLANTPAVVNDDIYVMPADYYLTEDVFAYITVLNGLSEAFNKM